MGFFSRVKKVAFRAMAPPQHERTFIVGEVERIWERGPAVAKYGKKGTPRGYPSGSRVAKVS